MIILVFQILQTLQLTRGTNLQMQAPAIHSLKYLKMRSIKMLARQPVRSQKFNKIQKPLSPRFSRTFKTTLRALQL